MGSPHHTQESSRFLAHLGSRESLSVHIPQWGLCDGDSLNLRVMVTFQSISIGDSFLTPWDIEGKIYHPLATTNITIIVSAPTLTTATTGNEEKGEWRQF